MTWPAHGANSFDLARKIHKPEPDSGLIDFSVNTNPFGPPPVLDEHWSRLAEKISQYPDLNYRRIRRKIADVESISHHQIMIGNGASELIHLLARWLRGRRVGVVTPTFSEYEQACLANSCPVKHLPLREENKWQLTRSIWEDHLSELHAFFLCHPNNPTGKTYDKKELKALIDGCTEQGIWLIIDEAFYDFVYANESQTSLLNQKRVIILRSLTKMYAIPGLRLGYLLAPERIIEQLQQYQPAWSVNTLAEEAGLWCLDHPEYAAETREWLYREKNYLFERLRDLNYQPIESESNYFLMNDPFHEFTKPMISFLFEEGIAVRHTYNYPGLDGRYVRVAVKRRGENDRLLSSLADWRTKCSQ